MFIDVTLPSGARGRVRGLKGRELNLFANKGAARRGKTSQQILANVWVETFDGGPLYEDGKIDWDKAPQCDRFTALFHARIASYGAKYEFKHKCGNEDCERKYWWVEDLIKRPIKPLPEASIATFKAGNRFTTSVEGPDGKPREVIFQLLTHKLEDKINQAQNMSPTEKATASLAQRIVSIEGVEAGKGPIKRFLEDMDASAIFYMLDLFDEVDGGIETKIEVECPHCGELEDLELPLGDEFWNPQRRKRSTESTETP